MELFLAGLATWGCFSMIKPRAQEMLYVGDLDGEGLQIASTVRQINEEVPFRPATWLPVAMFERRHC
jgi:hypothetical protein